MQQRELTIPKIGERDRGLRQAGVAALVGLAVAALALYAYRDLFARPFAADDYQWLLAVRGLSFAEVVRQAFDSGAQSHFYRPLVWLLFWAQERAFGLDPRGYHAVSLALHLLDAGLLGWLVWRLQRADCGSQADRPQQSTRYTLQSALLAAGVVALHPAPFEAVAWVSAQSELLAAGLLLAALHLWVERPATNGNRPSAANRGSSAAPQDRAFDDSSHLASADTQSRARNTQHATLKTQAWSLVFRPWSVLATLALALALLAKESAAIGLPLLMLLGGTTAGDRRPASDDRQAQRSAFDILRAQFFSRLVPYILPTLVTLAYVALQVSVERKNYLLAQGGYGLGPQIILNPLRSLALLVAPLPGSEHADAGWLVPAGAIVALLIVLWIFDFAFLNEPAAKRKTHASKLKIALALALTLLPTAPFVSPPDSRYLYLSVMAGAVLVASLLTDRRPAKPSVVSGLSSSVNRPWFSVHRRKLWLLGLACALALAWWSAGELRAREGRFAAAAGPGGSLWRLAEETCAAGRLERMVIVEPPVAPPHVEAIVKLACGGKVKTKIVGRDQIDAAIKGHTVVIDFPGGSAQIIRRT